MRTWMSMIAAAILGLGLWSMPAWAGGGWETSLVASWYQRYLHRNPEECGLRNWAGLLRCGKSPEEVEAGILGSDEYYHLHGCTPAGYVTGLYVDVLGRTPCHEEVCQWTRQLSRCGDRIKLAREFLCVAKVELARNGDPRRIPVHAPAPVYAPAPVPSHPAYAPVPVASGRPRVAAPVTLSPGISIRLGYERR